MPQVSRNLIILISCVFFSGISLVAQVAPPSNATGNANSDKNWIIARSFDETGKVVSENKQFVDNSGRLLQQQSKLVYRKNKTSVFTHTWASQPVRDAFGREAVSTMPAPIDYGDFNFKPDFMQNTSGGIYDYTKFDRSLSGGTEVDKTNNPDPVGGQSAKGTLGWFYSNNNTWEPYMPTTNYPYNRTTFYRDGTGRAKNNASSGEQYKMGSGHEISSYSWPVINELDNYLAVRNRFFTNAEVGEGPASLKYGAQVMTSRNADGREGVAIVDNSGKTLVSGRPGNAGGNGLTVSNTVNLAPYGYRFNFAKGDQYGGYTTAIKIVGDGYIWASQSNDNVNYALVFDGHNSAYIPPAQLTQYLRLESDRPFRVYFTTLNGAGTDQVGCEGCAATDLGIKPLSIHYFKLFGASPVTITGGSYKLYNMVSVNEAEVIGFTSGGTLAAGYYKLVATGKETVNLTYSNTFTDLSYKFYNQLGQLTGSIAPEGVKQLFNPASGANCPFNSLPVINGPVKKAIQHSTTQSMLISVADADLDPLTVTFEDLPVFAAVSTPSNGQRLLTFTPSAAQQGTYTVKVKVSDGVNQQVIKEIILIVNGGANLPPELPYTNDFVVRYGTTSVHTINAIDPNGDAITISVDNVPYFGYVKNIGNGHSELVLSPSIADQGAYSFPINATDAHGATTTQVINIVISNRNVPVINPVNDICAVKGQSVSVNLTATDGDGDILTWTATGLPSFATLTGGVNGTAVLQVSPGLADAGRYEVELKVDDGMGSSTTRKIFITAGGTSITNKTLAPFMSLYEYDVRGRLVKTQFPDGGIGELVYRNDGKIRFSQNAEQKKTNRYSYTNYDVWGRPIESGEYQPASGIAFNSDLSVSSPMKNILENTSSTGGLTNGTKRDVVIIKYDLVDNSHGVAGYSQVRDFLPGAVSMTQKYSSIVNNTPNSANLVSSTWYNYDGAGLVVWQVKYIAGLGYKTTDFTYDGLNRLIKKVYQKNVSTETFAHYYQYDPATQNLWKIFTGTDNDEPTKKLQATCIYYLNGALKRVELAGDLQGIDYTYTLQGTLKAINNSNKAKDPGGDGPNGFAADAFGMVLDYYPDDYKNGRAGIQPINGVNTTGITTDSYTGNIKAMSWFTKKPANTPDQPAVEEPTTYVYKYDDKYQFIESTWGTGLSFPASASIPATFTATGFNKESIKNPLTGLPAYDANGNIQNLQRTGSTGAITDKFTYNYQANTNKLQSVINDVNGVPEVYAGYEYDALGHLALENSSDPAKKKYIKYDVTGKVILVARDASLFPKVVEYVYDETGQRIVKKIYNSASQLIQVTYYTGDVVYTQDVTGGVGGNIVAAEYEISGGRGRIGTYYRPENIYAFELNDNLGNVRAVIAKNGSSLDVKMYTDYYPYGLILRRYGSGYRYEYQGQYAEKDGETDWNAFDLRMYDSRIARWSSRDPYGQYWSPYVAMGNDPINRTDPNGGFTGPEDRAKAFAAKHEGAQAYASGDGWLVNYTGKDGNTISKFFSPTFWENVAGIGKQVVNATIEVGKNTAAFGLGVVNAVAADNLLGAGLGDPETFGPQAGAARWGQKVGHVVVLVQSGVEFLIAGGAEVGGFALDATGVGAPAGLALNGAGVAVFVHSTAVGSTALSNLLKMEDASGEVHSESSSDGSGGSTEPSGSSFSKVSDNFLKQNGIDAHELKKEWLGNSAPIARYDIYREKVSGELLIFEKGGKGAGIRTGEFIIPK